MSSLAYHGIIQSQYIASAGETLIYNDTTVHSIDANTMTLLKAVQVTCSGVLRIKFSVQAANSNHTCEARIFKNGNVVGALRTGSLAYVQYTEDIPVAPYDHIQIFGHGYYSSNSTGGDTVIDLSAGSEVSTTQQGIPANLRGVVISSAGTCHVEYRHRGGGSTYFAYANVYKNGSPIGGQQSDTDNSYGSLITIDGISVSADDAIDIKGWVQSGAPGGVVSAVDSVLVRHVTQISTVVDSTAVSVKDFQIGVSTAPVGSVVIVEQT